MFGFLVYIKFLFGFAEFVTVEAFLSLLESEKDIFVTFYRSNKSIFLEVNGVIYQCEAGDKFLAILEQVIVKKVRFNIKENGYNIISKIHSHLFPIIMTMGITTYTTYFLQRKQVLKIEACKQRPTKRFDEIYANDLVKKKLLNIIKRRQNKQNMTDEKLLLLSGAPGTGKTILANAFANELRSEYIYKMTGFDILKHHEANPNFLADLFKILKDKNAVLFIDEVDALACNEYLLIEFTDKLRAIKSSDEYKDVVVLLATNNFSRIKSHFKNFTKICLSMPNAEERLEILKGFTLKYCEEISADLGAILTEIAQNADGMSGAQLAEIFDDLDESSFMLKDASKKVRESYEFVKKQISVN